jgi:hypothetical protein
MAILAIMWGALLPTLSHALQRASTEGWVEVCTMQGAKRVSAADADGRSPVPERSAAHVFEHCPYCSLHGADLALPPAPPVVMLVPSSFETPRPLLSAPRTLWAWRSAQARAPPLSS